MTESETPLKAGDFVTPTVQLVRPLAEGGMGKVWIADHVGLHTQVVVKLMSEEMLARADGQERFAREAAAAAAIKSPHVVQVFDHGVTDRGVPYIVMELLEGQDLARWLEERGRMEPGQAVALVVQVCRALHKAHKAGIVHRDIKPDNIFLCDTHEEPEDVVTPAGSPDTSGAFTPPTAVPPVELFVKLLDFGTAKRAEGVSKATVPGQIMGTPYYMSPEQSVGGELDERSDIWSLGVVVFEALTGRKPFDGASIGAIALAIHGVAPKLTDVVPSLPAEVDGWFARACAQKPEDRFPTAREASVAFVEAVTGLSALDQPAESVIFAPVGPRSAGPAAVTLNAPGERTPMQPVSRSMPPLRETLEERSPKSRFTTVAAGAVIAAAAATMIAIVAHRGPGSTEPPATAARPTETVATSASTPSPAAEPPRAPTGETGKSAAEPPKNGIENAKSAAETAKSAAPAEEPAAAPAKTAAHARPRPAAPPAASPAAPARPKHGRDAGAATPGHEDDDLLRLQNATTRQLEKPAPAPDLAPTPPPTTLPPPAPPGPITPTLPAP